MGLAPCTAVRLHADWWRWVWEEQVTAATEESCSLFASSACCFCRYVSTGLCSSPFSISVRIPKVVDVESLILSTTTLSEVVIYSVFEPVVS